MISALLEGAGAAGLPSGASFEVHGFKFDASCVQVFRDSREA